MNTLQESIKQIPGLRFVVESLQLSSAPGRRMLLATSWASEKMEVSQRIEEIARVVAMCREESKGAILRKVAEELCYLRIAIGSIETLASGATCSDIDFFELKGLALLEGRIRKLLQEGDIELTPIPSLQEALTILDPEGSRLESFYLSESFSKELARLRYEQELATTDEERTAIAQRAAQEEEKVRRELSSQLLRYAEDFKLVYNALAINDILLAKADWAIRFKASHPEIVDEGDCLLTDLWNPEVDSFLRSKGDRFQPVSIRFSEMPTLITGANMAGKSVMLATIALAQVMLQYGFYIPASEARLTVVERVMTSFSDGQDSAKGLSSYAAEILRLNEMIAEAKAGKKLLLLIDEAARTTNPQEGRAIVEAVVKLFNKYPSQAIITTHYSGINARARRYRVRGFIEDKIQMPPEVNKLNKCMDYSLVEIDQEETPQEAIRIAEILGVDEELIHFSRESLTRQQG